MPTKNEISVLIVDDSFFMRKLLREILESDPKIRVVGTARDGDEAIIKSRELKPDVITMDYSLPGRNGMDTLKEILLLNPDKKPSVIMISAYTLTGSTVALDCLRAGAVDFITKPSGELSMDIETIKEEILRKINVAFLAKIIVYPEHHKKAGLLEKAQSLTLSDKVVVIGSSTGGPPLVEDIIESLPVKFSGTVIVAQHMPPYFIGRFAERLDKTSSLSVTEAKDGDLMTEGRVYLVPADFDFEISEDRRIKLSVLGNYDGAKPSIDRVIDSAVKVYNDKVICVILSGMGEDGHLGAKKAKENSSYVIAQDPDTATIRSMPESIILSGLADEILIPSEIAKRLTSLIK